MSSKLAAKKLAQRKNKTRTHIWYEVDTGGAIERKDIPFDIAVMSDLSGDQERGDFRDRKFIEVADPAKFDSLLKSIKPKLQLEVDFGEEGSETTQNINLDFKSMKDFTPKEILDQLEKQVPEVKAMADLRRVLMETRETVNVSREFEAKLKEILGNPERMAELKAELEKEKS